MLNVKIKRLNERARFPTKATTGSGAYDVYSTEKCSIAPATRRGVPIGLAFEIPLGYVALVCPRSGLALNRGVTVLNGPGVVDSDYRGEVQAILANHDTDNVLQIQPGDKVAQLLFVKAEEADFIETEELSETTRGTGGFGSTGK